VWYFRTVPTVWYFRTVPTVWYFLFIILFKGCKHQMSLQMNSRAAVKSHMESIELRL
jgi:hypothetical protein